MILRIVSVCICVVASLSREIPPPEGRERCDNFVSNYGSLRESFEKRTYSRLLTVDPENGVDNSSCLTGSHSCRSITFAVYNGSHVNASELPRVMLEDVEIVLLPGDHHLQSLVMINGSSDVYIHGISALESTVRCTYFPNKRFPCEFDNLEIRDSRNVWIREITITECGSVSVGLFLAGSENVIVEDCIFKENGASGVFSFRSNKVYLVNNLVVDNQGLPLPSELVNHSCSGHITFTSIFNFRSSIGGGISITGGRNATCEVLIWKTTVANNSAPPPFETINIPNTFKPHGRGGGLSIVLQGSKDCHICLKDSTVKENRARLAAGGISYTLSQQASENSLTIDNSDIEGNICEETECIGGGIHFTSEGQGPSSLSNTLYMYDTSVLYNRAENGTGGGLVGVIFSNQSQYFISNCTFNGNVARREGSAIMLLSVTGVEKVGTQFSCWDW